MIRIETPVNDPTEESAIRPLRPPRLAGVVADRLRARILNGELTRLPREEDLRTELGVGKPALREAMRILEEEGLVTVMRGNRGGAMVHTPRPTTIAYALGLALTSRRAHAADVATALRQVEPACAALCALRVDRHRHVLPALWRSLAQSEEEIDNPGAVTTASRHFHEALVASCGNETLILLVGALEALWSAHVAALGEGRQARGDRPGRRQPRARAIDPLASLSAHKRIAELIEAGDADAARAEVAAHLDRVQGVPTSANTAGLIDMTALRSALRS